MGVLDFAIEDYEDFMSDEVGASIPMTITTPDGSTTADIRGLGMSHHLSFDTEGQMVNTKQSHVSIHENVLIKAGYPVRNDKDVVSLHKHKIEFADHRNVIKPYLIIQAFPDETLGGITCMLGEYE